MELWKKTPLGPEFIEVSNLGNVRGIGRHIPYQKNGKNFIQVRPGGIYSPWIGNNGYYHVSIQQGKTRPKYLVHRLVAAAWCDGFNPNLTVNHIDGQKTNNHMYNLEWVTLARNTQLEWETGLVNLRGENNPQHKLTEYDVLKIHLMLSSGISAIRIASEFGVSDSLIYLIRQGQRWNHVITKIT